MLLFRRTFTTTITPSATLDIFADTRYELWLDGTWIGRGPARFSHARQEYDSYTLDALDAGAHTLAVLAQYAPNGRRSEDLGGALFVRASASATGDVLVRTDADWRVLASPAWDVRGGYISSLHLVGPKEILDLRGLPTDWMQPAYDDSSWYNAQVLEPSPLTALTPRSIPMLVDHVRLPVDVVETGTLSPGCHLTTVQPQYGLTATATTTLRVEALTTPTLTLDDAPLIWYALNDERRPDVLTTTMTLTPGAHTLRVISPTNEGDLFALCAEGVDWGTLPAPLSYRPEQRMLLANPIPGGDTAPSVHLTPDGAEIDIPAGNTPRYVVLDFGRTLHVRIVVTAAGETGTVIDAGWDERLTANRPLPNPGSLAYHYWSQADTWILDGTPRPLTTLDTRAGRYLLLQVLSPSAVQLRGLHALEETYPVEPRGSFTSSDPLLNRIWQVGVETLIPNMTDAYTDTPWRERGQWWGDAWVTFHINRVVYGDVALFRRGLRQTAEAMGTDGHPAALAPNAGDMLLLDYGLVWGESLYTYWQLTGDRALLTELYPYARQMAEFLRSYEGQEGLLDLPVRHWSKSALVDWPAETSRSGEATALNAQYAAFLQQLSEMALALGDDELAERDAAHSRAIRDGINRLLWLPEQGLYAASRCAGEYRPPSLHAQAYALRYSIPLTATQRASVARGLSQQLSPFFMPDGEPVVETYGLFWVLDVLGQNYQTGTALRLIREQFGRMLDAGATTWWEIFSQNQGRWQSLSHAWGGTPTWYLSTYVLGAQVHSAQAERTMVAWRVAPQIGDLTWARGTIPMGEETLAVAWEREGQTLHLSITAPPTTTGEIVLPITLVTTRVILNNAVVWDNGLLVNTPSVEMGTAGLHISGLTGGSYEITAITTVPALYFPVCTRTWQK
ncbi:MAG: hypothetical protein JXA21_13575 [Anaerolineae bacterium]|nr:hypothetical protein [Anaerolineae bacterium]